MVGAIGRTGGEHETQALCCVLVACTEPVKALAGAAALIPFHILQWLRQVTGSQCKSFSSYLASERSMV